MLTELNVKEIVNGDSFRLGYIKITTVEMTYVIDDIAYRFDVDGKPMVVSGGTSFDKDLVS